jgi:DegV family protein with EDD domain
MPSVAVITDSTASAGIDGSAAGLRVIPVWLLFSDGEASDPDVDPASVYARLAQGEVVKSQAPPPADYLDAIEVGDNESALVLTPAHEFTPMAHNARIAAELAARPCAVVDTRTAAAGQGLVVRAALAAAAAEGADLDIVTAVARETAARTNLVAAIFDPRQLAHSGHVASASLAEADPGEAMLARFRDGQVVPLAAAGDALRALTAAWRTGRGDPATTLVFHSDQRRRAEVLSERLGLAAPVLACSAAMGAHVGPGVVGVAWLQPPASEVQRRSNAAS